MVTNVDSRLVVPLDLPLRLYLLGTLLSNCAVVCQCTFLLLCATVALEHCICNASNVAGVFVAFLSTPLHSVSVSQSTWRVSEQCNYMSFHAYLGRTPSLYLCVSIIKLHGWSCGWQLVGAWSSLSSDVIFHIRARS